MIEFLRGGWKVSRRIGVGDREHVRAGLLQICYVEKSNTKLVLESCIRSALNLRKTLRFYFNKTRLTDKENHDLVFVVMGQARDHDLMDESSSSRKRFDWILGRCDLIIEGSGSSSDLIQLIMDAWSLSHERNLLKSSDRALTENEIREKFIDYYGREDELWSSWEA